MSHDPNTGLKPQPGMPRLFSLILMAVGGLMMALCGTCTLVVAVTAIQSSPSLLLVAALVGGVPTAIGFVIFRSGLIGYRRLTPSAKIADSFD